MVQYYYNKYTAVLNTTYTEPPMSLYNEFAATRFEGMYKSATWNGVTYTLGGGTYGTYDDITTGNIGYTLDSVDLNIMEAKNWGVAPV